MYSHLFDTFNTNKMQMLIILMCNNMLKIPNIYYTFQLTKINLVNITIIIFVWYCQLKHLLNNQDKTYFNNEKFSAYFPNDSKLHLARQNKIQYYANS